MAEEVRSELIKDLNKTTVAMPGETVPVWASVSGMASFWTDQIIKVHADELAYNRVHREMVHKMAQEMARRIDKDLMDAMVPKEKQFVTGIPDARINKFGQLEIRAGLAKQETIWGDEYRVEYIRPTELIIPGLDKRGQAEYAGLIVPEGN